ncbi:tRNA dimethylallyltransferase-like [Glandiceps talaboti]
MRVFRRFPVVVILGATGAGKSKLALEIGAKMNGEIISADSMQVYKGLDIITNKVTTEERQQCPHHVIDFIEPLSRYTVVDFRNKAVPIIDGILAKKKLPIIVGGTNYYIESLLWKILIDSKIENSDELISQREDRESKLKRKRCVEDTGKNTDSKLQRVEEIRTEPKNNECGDRDGNRQDSEDDDDDSEEERDLNIHVDETITVDNVKQNELRTFLSDISFEKISSVELHEKLQEVDSSMAERFHPNDKRKIYRSLQVFAQYGIKHSVLLDRQRSESGSSVLGGPLRYKDTCILWLQCNQEVLDERLDTRVDKMIEQGLLEELLDFHTHYNQQRLEGKTDSDELYTHGIFQSIGFKEFHKYLIMSEEERESDKGKELLDEGVAALKLATRRYGRKQNRWVRNRFIKRPGSDVPAVYGLDSTDVNQWDANVYQPAIQIVQALCQGERSPISPLPHEQTPNIDIHVSHRCEVCNDRLIVGQQQWTAHLRSRGHQKKLKKQKQLQKLMEGAKNSNEESKEET